jgi:hypothetical protein
MFTELAGDMNPSNDTIVGNTRIAGAVFADTLVVHRTQVPPTIDGVINPWEWRASIQYDISDLAGRGGTGPQTAGTNYAYFMWDHDFVYFAMDFPKYTGRADYDQFGPFMDEDKSGTWSTDSSEGNYWVEYLSPTDSCVYRALLNTTPTVWLMGNTPGSQSVSSTTIGHLQFETKIPVGTDKWLIDISPDAADTIGYFQFSANDGGSTFLGWWPQSLLSANWANPQYYGPMIFDPTLGVESQNSKPQFALYKASPSILRDHARISYYVAGRSNVTLGVYDMAGKLVKTLASGQVTPGERTAIWNRSDNNGKRVANGAYFYRLCVDGKSVSGKAIVLQ